MTHAAFENFITTENIMPRKQRQSTKTTNSYASTRYNATKHGALSRVPVLPWENADEFAQLQDDLVKEYNPQGASEEHLVFEIANCIFRKQRVYQAENALIMSRIGNYSSGSLKRMANLLVPGVVLDTSFGSKDLDLKSALNTDSVNPQEAEIRAQNKYLSDVQAVIDSDLSYEKMLNHCPPAAVKIWHDWLGNEGGGYTPDKKSFKEFLTTEVIEWCEAHASEVQARPYIRQQLVGLSYVPNSDTDHLQRHETTLDRRLEKSVGMLLKLQEVRATKLTTIIDQPANSVL